jgi:cytochrome c oxidase subunit 2
MSRLWNVLWLAPWLLSPQAAQKAPDRVVSIVAERFSFFPSRIKVKTGQEIELVLTSEDTEHGFRVPDTNIDGLIPPPGKGELRVRFSAVKKGKFPFECSRACGAGHNLMRGMIVVE